MEKENVINKYVENLKHDIEYHQKKIDELTILLNVIEGENENRNN